MPIVRLPETTLTLYAELLDQLRSSAGIARSGSFVSKTIGGSVYWYIQRVDGGRKRQIYLGADSQELRARIARAEEGRAALDDDERRRRELVTMLTAGRMAGESGAVGGVLSTLAESGLFRAGAVLVGTQAFTALANMLGVRFEAQTLRTSDVDLGHPVISVAVGEMRTDILEDLRAADPRFVAVPELDVRQPRTSFKVRGRDVRVDLLTPGRESAKPVLLRHLNAAALPLPGLDYLIADVTPAAVLAGGGVLVNVPTPARYALHKLWVAQRRPAAEQGKARKDVRQASQLLEVLLEDRPHDLSTAWKALSTSMIKVVRRATTALAEEIRGPLTEAAGDAALSRR